MENAFLIIQIYIMKYIKINKQLLFFYLYLYHKISFISIIFPQYMLIHNFLHQMFYIHLLISKYYDYFIQLLFIY